MRPAAATAAAVGTALALVGVVANAFLLALDGLTWGTLGALSTDPANDAATHLGAGLLVAQSLVALDGRRGAATVAHPERRAAVR